MKREKMEGGDGSSIAAFHHGTCTPGSLCYPCSLASRARKLFLFRMELLSELNPVGNDDTDANVTLMTESRSGSADEEGFGKTDQTADVVSDKEVEVVGNFKECEADTEEATTSSDSSQQLAPPPPDEQGLEGNGYSARTSASGPAENEIESIVESKAETVATHSEQQMLSEVVSDEQGAGESFEVKKFEAETETETESQETLGSDQLISEAVADAIQPVEVNELEAELQAVIISDSDDSNHKPNCAVCPEVGVNHCKKCGKVNYCSREHQVQDWKSHRAHCFPFEIRTVTMDNGRQKGRYMFATRDIAKGEKLLTEKPLVFGPKSRYPFEIICLGCCTKISTLGDRNSGINVPCSKCKWMVCGPECEKIPMHSENECELFVKMNLTPENNALVQSVALYDSITVLRLLLLKKKDEAKFDKLMSVSFDEASRRRGSRARYTTTVPKKFLRELCGVEFSDETCETAFDVVKANSAAMCEVSPGQPSNRYMSIFFENTVVLAPLCVSNMRWAIFPSKEPHRYSITTGASTDIKKGEMLSGEFTHYMTGTQVRRKVLSDQFFQNCMCRRCSDPAELGTYSSSLRCLNTKLPCKAGYYLPLEPLNPDSEFECDKCEDRVPAERIITMISFVAKNLDQAYFINADPDDPTEDEEEIICGLEKQLRELKGKVLHPNHYLIVKTCYSICLRFMNVVAERSAGNVKLSLAERVLDHCKTCLEMSNIFNPGHSRVRGRILYVLQLCMGIVVIRQITGKPGSRLTDAIRRYRKKKLDEVVAVQEECYKILEFEPNGTEEHIIRLTLKNQMAETQQVIRCLFVKESKTKTEV